MLPFRIFSILFRIRGAQALESSNCYTSNLGSSSVRTEANIVSMSILDNVARYDNKAALIHSPNNYELENREKQKSTPREKTNQKCIPYNVDGDDARKKSWVGSIVVI